MSCPWNAAMKRRASHHCPNSDQGSHGHDLVDVQFARDWEIDGSLHVNLVGIHGV